MSVVAIKDGVMAFDSLCCNVNIVTGLCIKGRSVPEKYGGGWIGSAGRSGQCYSLMEHFCSTGKIKECKDREASFIHLTKDGKVYFCDDEDFWVEITSDHYALGSGGDIARGAMEAGASAKQAVEIACKLDINTGLPIHVCTVYSTGE